MNYIFNITVITFGGAHKRRPKLRGEGGSGIRTGADRGEGLSDQVRIIVHKLKSCIISLKQVIMFNHRFTCQYITNDTNVLYSLRVHFTSDISLIPSADLVTLVT